MSYTELLASTVEKVHHEEPNLLNLATEETVISLLVNDLALSPKWNDFGRMLAASHLYFVPIRSANRVTNVFHFLLAPIEDQRVSVLQAALAFSETACREIPDFPCDQASEKGTQTHHLMTSFELTFP